jgi:hypothetical protein
VPHVRLSVRGPKMMGAAQRSLSPLQLAASHDNKSSVLYQQSLCPYQEARGAPYLARFLRDAPNFLHATLNKTACAPFFKERRMRFAEPTKLHRKSGMWDTTALDRKSLGPVPYLGARPQLQIRANLPHQSTPAPATYTDQTCRSSQRPQPSPRTIFCRKP